MVISMEDFPKYMGKTSELFLWSHGFARLFTLVGVGYARPDFGNQAEIAKASNSLEVGRDCMDLLLPALATL